jgi:hypothetical protein
MVLPPFDSLVIFINEFGGCDGNYSSCCCQTPCTVPACGLEPTSFRGAGWAPHPGREDRGGVVGTDSDVDEKEISSYTELLTWARYDGTHFQATRTYQIEVWLNGRRVWATRTIKWSENGLNKGIKAINIHFQNHVPPGASFKLLVYAIRKGNRYVTVAEVTPSFVRKGTSLSARNGAYRAIFRSVGGSSRKTISKVPAPPVSTTSEEIVGGYELKITGIHSIKTTIGSSDVPYTMVVKRKKVQGVKTPNYHRLAKQGKLPVQPYSLEVGELNPGATSWNKDYDDGSFSHQIDSSSRLLLLPSSVPHLEVSTNKLIGKLSDAISGFEGAGFGEDIATASQTIGLFSTQVGRMNNILSMVAGKSPADDFIKSVFSNPRLKRIAKLTRIAKRAGKSGSKLLASLWLEYRFGIIPLVSDAQAAVAAFGVVMSGAPNLGKVTASVSNSEDSVSEMFGLTDFSPADIVGANYYYSKTIRRIGISYTVSSQASNALAHLGLTTPLATAWELIPFSFMIDWAYPIGQALNAYSAFDGMVFGRGYQTTFTRMTINNVCGYATSIPNITNIQIGGRETFVSTSSYKGVKMDRVALTDFPSPTLPTPKNPVSVIHAANALAVLRQKVRIR